MKRENLRTKKNGRERGNADYQGSKIEKDRLERVTHAYPKYNSRQIIRATSEVKSLTYPKKTSLRGNLRFVIRGPFIIALNRTWCPDHFHCNNLHCKTPLLDIGFVEEQGQLYCENCYEAYLAPICNKCNVRIKGVRF
ncbi:UNVERIFIED_CONTAM: Zasp52 [Trichonephila clavipes]